MVVNRAKMVGCSNKESVGMKELGEYGRLNIEKVFYFNSIRSSYVKNIEFKEDMIIITTKNTTYTFMERE